MEQNVIFTKGVAFLRDVFWFGVLEEVMSTMIHSGKHI